MIKDSSKIAIMSAERDVTYSQLLDYINLFASNNPATEGDKTIIFSENREGWLYAFYSVWQSRGLAVPVDASSTVSDLIYILNDCKPTSVWTSTSKREVVDAAVKESGLDINILLIDDYEQAECPSREGKIYIQNEDIFTPENNSPAVIIYTSGTTGSPKGVVLSYANIYANYVSVTDDVPIFDGKRRAIILLPLHHVLPLVGTVIMPIVSGGGVAISPSMSGPDIMNTLQRGEIGIFVGVPRLWQTLYTGIKKKIDSSAVTRALFSFCEKVNSPALSRTIFKAVHQKLGGHLAYCISGGAALDKEIGEGLRTLGITMLEGYGMSETAPIISFTRPGDIIPGCVGLPMKREVVKIVDGEICVKGPNVMLGYYNRPEETAQVIDKDGFVHTGDLGFIDEEGRIHITGRSKEIIILSNGKNVQPNEIEYKLEKYDDKVKEVAVTQDGDMLCAIIVPQEDWAASLSDSEVEEALKREVIEPYNRSVTNYKKIMNIFVYRGELPRTKLDKLQRFKLKDILNSSADATDNTPSAKEENIVIDESLAAEYKILKNYIEGEKKIDVRPTDHFETDLAFDSLDNVGLQGFIEQTFGIEVKADTFASYKNVLALAEHIAKSKTRMEVENVNWKQIIDADSSSLQLPSTSSLFTTYAAAFHGFLRMHNNLEIKGKENIPTDGQFIIAPNHQCFLDGPICVAGLSNKMLKQCYFYAKEGHVGNGVVKYMAQHNNVIVMEQLNLKNSILKLAQVLKMGKSIAIFPEGTRTKDGSVGVFKKTFAILSKELNVPIIPVCISGAFEAMPRGKKVPSGKKITVEYLKPIIPAEADTYEGLVERTRNAIIEVLS